MNVKFQPPPPPSLTSTPYICCKVKYKRISCKNYKEIYPDLVSKYSISPRTNIDTDYYFRKLF